MALVTSYYYNPAPKTTKSVVKKASSVFSQLEQNNSRSSLENQSTNNSFMEFYLSDSCNPPPKSVVKTDSSIFSRVEQENSKPAKNCSTDVSVIDLVSDSSDSHGF